MAGRWSAPDACRKVNVRGVEPLWGKRSTRGRSRFPSSGRRGDRLGGTYGAGRGSVAERTAAESLPVVRGGPAGGVRADGDHARGVHVAVHDVVVLLDLVEVDRVPEPRSLEQVARVRPQHRHLGQLAPVALEVAVVDGVEPDQRGE